MGLRETIANEEARATLVSLPAVELLHGAVSLDEDELFGWVRPARFSVAQQRALGSCLAWHPGLYRQMAQTTAGIVVEFETDACEVALEVRVDREPQATRAVLEPIDRLSLVGLGPHDGFSADIDGRRVWLGMPAPGERLVELRLDGGDPEDVYGLTPLPGMSRTRHVRIWLPALRGCMVRRLYCDGTTVGPVPRRKQLLAIGDSIVQGFVSEDPACAWPTLLAQRLDLDVVNQGVGGQVFQPGSLAGLAGAVNPAHIVVSLGENYRFEPCAERRVSADIQRFFGELSRLWPKVPTHVLTPLWHDEEAYPSHPKSCFDEVPRLIAEGVALHEQMTLIYGQELLDHEAELLADGIDHPNERGCRQIALRLASVLKAPGARPSSAGRRRKRKTKDSVGVTISMRKPSAHETMQIPFE